MKPQQNKLNLFELVLRVKFKQNLNTVSGQHSPSLSLFSGGVQSQHCSSLLHQCLDYITVRCILETHLPHMTVCEKA